MNKPIQLATRMKVLVNEDEPCGNCADQPTCRNTCEKARIWWDNFAKQFGRKS